MNQLGIRLPEHRPGVVQVNLDDRANVVGGIRGDGGVLVVELAQVEEGPGDVLRVLVAAQREPGKDVALVRKRHRLVQKQPHRDDVRGGHVLDPGEVLAPRELRR